MPHSLEQEYGLSADELLDAMARRFRARVTLEGAVAEVHMAKHVAPLVGSVLRGYEAYDVDGEPDFGLFLPDGRRVLAECKNVRDRDEAYRSKGEIVAYKVETQKTRTSGGDPTRRFYGVDQFDILGVCLGKKTGDWTRFMFARTADLARHAKHPSKLAVMQRVPLPDVDDFGPWSPDLRATLEQL